MDLHKNALLTVRSRERIADGGRTGLHAEAGRGRRTAVKWVQRCREAGVPGLLDRSSRPHQARRPTRPKTVVRVETLRRQRWTSFRIAHATGLSRASVSRILRRLQLNRMCDLDPPLVVQRYEHAAPGDLLYLDIKRLARIV